MNYLARHKLFLFVFFILFSTISCEKSSGQAQEKEPEKEEPKKELITTTYKNPVFEPILADPSVVRGDDGVFYAYGTEDNWGDGKGTRLVPIIKSENLVDWTYVAPAFSSKPSWKTGGWIWAVDVVKLDGKYLMYYSYSTWGDTNPGVGVAEAPTPAGPFKDLGKLFFSNEVNVPNTIDPFYYEEGGKKYLFFGSFGSTATQGTYAIELSDDGKKIKDINKKMKIAGGDFEAVMIHKREGLYYFFGSKGSCCEGANSTYNVRYGHSESLLGPYLDKDGKDIRERGRGTLFLSGVGNQVVAGPGHNARIITDDAGVDWFIYHGILRNNPKVSSGASRRTLMMDKVVWNNKWPIISGNTPSTKEQAGPSFEKK